METALGAPVALTFIAAVLAAVGSRIRRIGVNAASDAAVGIGLGLMLGGGLSGALAAACLIGR